MSLRVDYPCDRRSMEPSPLKAEEIWDIAHGLRRQFLPRRPTLCFDTDRLVRAARKIRVNAVEIVVHWDLNRSVRDSKGREALGVTEADPALPGALLISLNADLIAERDYLYRSTIAHELGHALFDGPAMLRQARRPAFAVVTADEAHFTKASCGRSKMDWREFRANEFMGAFLTPRELLQRELIRRAIALGLPLRDAGEDHPVLRAAADPHRIEALLLDLAERFGVSAAFIEYRLHRYQLVR